MYGVLDLILMFGLGFVLGAKIMNYLYNDD